MPIFQDNRPVLNRLKWVRMILILLFALLVGRLWQLGILQHDRYRALAERNHVRTIPLLSPRGLIYDLDGRVLVDNVYGWNLVLFKDEMQDLDATLQFLERGLQVDPQRLRERLEQVRNYALYQPVVIKENLSIEQISYFLSHQSEYPELKIFRQPRRIYRYAKTAAHALGYVGEISPEGLALPQFRDNKPGDIVGKYGLERQYNRRLSGKDGYRRVLVNSFGKTLYELDRTDPVEGKELHLTLDLDLQMIAEEELADSPGAIFAFNPTQGEVLAMASNPAFDPNSFATHVSQREWEVLVNHPDHPFQNRVIQSSFSPGSIFKVFVGLAGLENGIVDRHTTVVCSGSAILYGHEFRCWKKEGHGEISLQRAIQVSCNVYFYLLGQKLGIEHISRFSRKLGLGVRTGIELAGEAKGLIPSVEWKRQTTGRPWYPGETISVAIGQGPLNITPIQLARAVGVIATGQTPQLHLLKDQRQSQPRLRPAEEFYSENLTLVREAMWKVVKWGTGRAAQVRGFEVCGKTGTAQIISRATQSRLSAEGERRFRPNAWFVGFAPHDAAEIVVAVIVQRGGSGGSVAAPIAGRIFQEYYKKYKVRASPMLEATWKVDPSKSS